MSKVLDEVLAANANYAANFGDKGSLPMPPGRSFAILTCMDARLDPAKYAGLAEGDAHVIRNAGGRASDDAIRSLVISHKLLGTNEWFVIHHTDCGMQTFTNEVMGDLLASSLETASVDASGWHDNGAGPGTTDGRFINWLTIADQPQSVLEDVLRIRNSPMVPADVPIYGYIYDCASGKLIEVPAATAAGKAK
ncbi:MAG: carbonic anhydrase [Caldilineaceae bacterium]